MSWHYLRGPAGESLADCCTGGEPLPPLKSKITHGAFFSNGKLTDAYLNSLYGTMCGHLTAGRGEGGSMSLAGDSPAKTFPAPAKEPESQANGLDFGKSLQGSFAKFDRDSCSWKTRQCSLFEGLELYSATWPRWGLMEDVECLELSTPVRLTSGSESGLWPTPRAGKTSDENEETWQKRKDAGKVCTPPLTLAVKMFPTPCATDHKGSGKNGTLRDRLDYACERGATKSNTYATPQARDFRTGQKSRWENPERTRNLNDQVGGQLNPTWVEWLMGWPLGWTDLKPLATGKSPCALQQRGNY